MSKYYLLFIISLLFANLASAQDELDTTRVYLPHNAAGQVQWQIIKSVDAEITPAQMITRAQSWAAKYYTSAKTVTQLYDPAAGVLIIKAVSVVPTLVKFRALGAQTGQQQIPVSYVLQVDSKPGRYRVTLSDYTIEGAVVPVASRSAADIYAASDRKKVQEAVWAADTQRQLYTGIARNAGALLNSLDAAMQEKDW